MSISDEHVCALLEIVAGIVQTNGIAFCYDRYCNDDEWSYCIFCEEGIFNPHEEQGWEHTSDCLLMRARILLDKIEADTHKPFQIG